MTKVFFNKSQIIFKEYSKKNSFHFLINRKLKKNFSKKKIYLYNNIIFDFIFSDLYKIYTNSYSI